jgi:dipeptidyl aminopeptidase/acylaminoacyl peptidase
VHVADPVTATAANGHGDFAVSQNGVLSYFQDQGGRGGQSTRGGATNNFDWGWVSRTGAPIAKAFDGSGLGDIDLSPNGKLVAITKVDGTGDIWAVDWQRASVSYRVTIDPGDNINPIWSQPDGDRIAFTTWRKGNADIYIKNANGTGPETPLLATAANESIKDWSKDGRYIAYKQGPEGAEDIWILPMSGANASPTGRSNQETSGDKKPFPMVQGPYHKEEPQFSYDGKWLAYTSDESAGKFQVFVTSFPGGEQKLQVSRDGGAQPRWRADGKELFFRALDGNVMAVDIKVGPRIEAGVPHVLFSGGPSASSRDPLRHMWAVSPDGQRFLQRIPAVATANAGRGAAQVAAAYAGAGAAAQTAFNGQGLVSSALTVVHNWTAISQKAAP